MRTVDLYCGIGGMSLGFELAGFEIVGAYDAWHKAIDMYNLNFGHVANVSDLSDVPLAISRIRKLRPEVIIGGPPCQDFSSAGNRHENKNAHLTNCFADIILSIRPQLYVMENVVRTRHSIAYQQAKKKLSESYNILELVLNAGRYSVPQVRKRFFSIGFYNKMPRYFLDFLHSKGSKEDMSIRKYFSSIKADIDTDYYYRHPRNYSRRGIYSIDEPSATIRGVNRPIPPNYIGHSLDAAAASQARPLTTKERSLIQTFPPEWKLSGTKTNVEQMIGNAVPVNLAASIAKGLAYEYSN